MRKTFTLALVSLALLTITGIGFAADAPEDKWQFGATLPLWAVGIDGDVTVRGVKQDVDIGFDDLTEHLDASFSLGLEVRKRRLGFYGGVGYMKFSADGNALGGKADYELKFIIADAGVSYRLIKTAGEKPFVLDAIGGVRYWGTENDLEITGPGGAVLADNESKNDLIDPIIGLRGSKYLTGKFHLDFQGDIGGFGITDDSADLDWSATGLASYDFAKWFTLAAGYKALALDIEEGSGAKKKGADVILHGLLIAAKFQF